MMKKRIKMLLIVDSDIEHRNSCRVHTCSPFIPISFSWIHIGWQRRSLWNWLEMFEFGKLLTSNLDKWLFDHITIIDKINIVLSSYILSDCSTWTWITKWLSLTTFLLLSVFFFFGFVFMCSAHILMETNSIQLNNNNYASNEFGSNDNYTIA